jgi:hemerythrin
MWKESLRIGVNSIDEQHKELFEKTDELLCAVQGDGEDKKQKCVSAILFLKDYAVRHFADEEAYQRFIGYRDYDLHKKMHEKFVAVVLEHERKMLASDFDDRDVKAFTGMLMAWILHHVSDADQKITKKDGVSETPDNYKDIIINSVIDVLCNLAGLNSRNIGIAEDVGQADEDAFAVEIDFTGDITGHITFVYPFEFIQNLIYSMAGFRPDSIGELEVSALFETSNIISGAVSTQFADFKGSLCDISPPRAAIKPEIRSNHDIRIMFDTGIGVIETDIAIGVV